MRQLWERLVTSEFGLLIVIVIVFAIIISVIAIKTKIAINDTTLYPETIDEWAESASSLDIPEDEMTDAQFEEHRNSNPLNERD